MELVIPGATHLWLFTGAALALLLLPGPAVLYIVTCSMSHGRRAGMVSVVGIHAATLMHVAGAALGLSALLASSALAFSVVKYAGAAYLVWIGLRKLFGPATAAAPGEIKVARNRARLFREGFVVNLLNPKTALFFLAFLPQFADLDRGHVAQQIAFLGLYYTFLGLVTDGAYALAAGTAGDLLRQNRCFAVFERYISGIVMIGLGLTAALAGTVRK